MFEEKTLLAKALLAKPPIAYPTIFVFFGSFISYFLVCYYGPCGLGFIPTIIAIPFLAFFCYAQFTVLHDSVHGSVIPEYPILNTLIGYVACHFLGPLGPLGYDLFHIIHITHHKSCNDPKNDPDKWCSPDKETGTLELLLRCGTLDFWYYYYWLTHLRKQNQRDFSNFYEILRFIFALSICYSFYWLYQNNYGDILFLYFLIPTRMSVAFLGYTFDHLPHSPLKYTPQMNRYKTTYFIKFPVFQPLFTLLLFYQDFHVIHHLYPTIPFYRYVFVWNEKGEDLSSRVPIKKLVLNSKIMEVSE